MENSDANHVSSRMKMWAILELISAFEPES